MSSAAELVLAAGIPTIVLIGVLVAWWRQRRRLHRAMHLAAARLSTGPLPEFRGFEPTLAQLERAVDDAVVAGGDASAAETRMNHALVVINDGILLIDEHGEIDFRNEPAVEFLAARHSEAVIEAAIEEMTNDALDGRRSTRTVELFGPPRRVLNLIAEPLDDGSKSIGALVVIRDITERRRLDAVRRDFVANISHELKTPVGGLGVLAETMVLEDDVEVMRRLANRMHVEAMRASRTIDDLLELSRIEAGESALRDPIPLHLLLAEAVERAQHAAENHGIAIDLEEPSRQLELFGDRRQLVSAIFNLIDNAVKYSESGSSVHVRGAAHDGCIDVSVADHGIGIPRRDLERIFERFYRVDRARSRETGGTGLGLAIVRHVASNHGGEVLVDSQEGVGTTMTLRFPASSAQAARPDGDE